MSLKRYLLMTLFSALLVPASAQQFGGLALGQSDFLITDMVRYGQNDFSFGTARTSAMGGAFTSLGADLSAMSINPAGLGMYRSTEFGVTGAANFAASKFDMPYGDNSRNRVALNNIGIACNLYASSGTLTSFTLGVGYNKLADYNYRYSGRTPNSNASIADLFERQLEGTASSSLSGDRAYWNTNQYLWGAVLAYKNYLIDPASSDAGNMSYITTSIAPDADIEHLSQVDSKGYLGEYTISGGANFNNKLYVGMTIGMQDLHHDSQVFYGETYYNNGLTFDASGNVNGETGNAPSNVPLMYTDYIQRTVVDGVGINFKVGAIVRPIGGLRIGVAVHTPTFMKIDRSYQGMMYVKGYDLENDRYVESDRNVQYTDELKSKCEYSTPTRLLAGISYTFGQYAILAVDYERTWYNGMRLNNVDGVTKSIYKSAVQNNFKAANTLRAGLEVRPLPFVALRLGYAYYGSMLRNNDMVFDNPVQYATTSISAGVGFNFGNFVLDLAYVNQSVKLSTYDLFYYQNAEGNFTSESGQMTGKLNRNQVMVSFGIKM